MQELCLTYQILRIMPDTLSDIVDNLAEGSSNNQCKYCTDKCLKRREENPQTKCTDCKCYREHAEIKDKILQFECLTLIKFMKKSLMKT